MCIESIKQDRYGNIEVKLHGKDWTIDKINKHIGFYESDNKQKASLIIDTEGFSEEKQKRLDALKAKLLLIESS